MKHEESKLQTACVRWFRYQYPEASRLLIHVPNGGWRHIKEAQRLKAEGVVAGVADLILFVPRKNAHGLHIEMKTPKGKQSKSQKEWEQAVNEQGYAYIIVRSFDEFKHAVMNYLL